MAYEAILFEKKDRVAWITLNRPDKLNAINTSMGKDLERAFEEIEADDDVRAVVIKGAGKAFCVGADIREPMPEAGLYKKINVRRSISGRGFRFYTQIKELGKPVIAAIHGYCLGGGLELAMACDLRLAGQDAQIGDQHARIGLIGGAGSSVRLPRLVGIAKAKELLFTGNPISGTEAERIGLINRAVPSENLQEEAASLAKTLTERSPILLKLLKMLVDHGMQMDEASALEYEQKCFLIIQQAQDTMEALAAYMAKRTPDFKGR